MLEEKIGYLVAKVEELSADQRVMGEKLAAVEKRVDEKFAAVEAIGKFLALLGSIAMAAIMLPWDKLVHLVKRFVS